MSGNEKQPLVPRLRFPEFREAEGWIAKKLKSTCEVNPPNSGLPETFAYIDLESVEAGELKARKVINRAEAPSRAQRLLRYGDVIFQIVRPYQRNNLLFKIKEDIPFVASTGYAQLRAIESEDFLFQAVHTDDFVERVVAKCTGSNYPAINSSDLADISLAIPRKTEQQKIADCLSSLDELIAAEMHKLDTLKTRKKSLMQQLFPREGETLPRLRFPEFREAGEWESQTLSYFIASLDAGVSVNSGDRPAYRNEIGVLKTSCVADGSFNLTENKVVLDADDISRVKEPVSANTIIISRMNTIALVGANAFVESDIPNLFLPDRLWAAKSSGCGNMRFLAYVLGSERGRTALSGLASGSSGTMKNIGKSEVLALRIMAPTILEQDRIADYLSSLNSLITAQGQKIEALKTHKKGLMQQLFPVLDEVSA